MDRFTVRWLDAEGCENIAVFNGASAHPDAWAFMRERDAAGFAAGYPHPAPAVRA